MKRDGWALFGIGAFLAVMFAGDAIVEWAAQYPMLVAAVGLVGFVWVVVSQSNAVAALRQGKGGRWR